jgi:hypothetical protein
MLWQPTQKVASDVAVIPSSVMIHEIKGKTTKATNAAITIKTILVPLLRFLNILVFPWALLIFC